MSRRRTDPRELAAVLERLERLRPGSAAATGEPAVAKAEPAVAVRARAGSGWVPADPDPGPEPVEGGRHAGRASIGVRLLALWRARSFDPGRNGLAVLAVVALMAALGGVWYFVTARPAAGSAVRQPVATPTPGLPGPAAASVPPVAQLKGWPTPNSIGSPTPTASSAAPIVVDVVGKVAAPGVVELPAGARIRDAIDAAGGALPGVDLTALDLASRLSDGQEIFVGIAVPTGTGAQAAGGVVGGAGAGGGGGGSGTSGAGAASGSSSSIVDLNAASLTDLETLPGVGPVLAQHILDWRLQHGNFTSVSQLQQVSGIGPAKYAGLVSRVRV